jgi:CubicO group peptidase (beta-lactamase class C family)
LRHDPAGWQPPPNGGHRLHGAAQLDLLLQQPVPRRGQACTRATRFQICSVSKQFTAAAVLLLADRRRLTVDDPIRRWFGGCPGEWHAITIHHLLTHTSGLGHWRDYPGLDLTRPVPQQRQLELFWQMPLLSDPGSRWRYSSPGFALLGWIVQQMAGQP